MVPSCYVAVDVQEDADLFSINYLHFGVSKVWYCVSPAHRGKFERMAQSLFPELHKGCSAFLRHKDILLSPSVLRTYGVEYVQAKQDPNEFIVLNAGAYHSGYNLGFNCAEAVNFATEDWIEIGSRVKRCKCEALRDGVRISMKLFGCSSAESDSSDSDSDEEVSTSEVSSTAGSDSEQDESESPDAARRQLKGASSSGRGSGGNRKRAADTADEADQSNRKHQRVSESGGKLNVGSAVKAASVSARMTKTAMAAAAAAAKARSYKTSAEARAKIAASRGRGGRQTATERTAASLERAAAAAAAIRARAEAAAAKADEAARAKAAKAAAKAKAKQQGKSKGSKHSSKTTDAGSPKSSSTAAPDSPRATKASLTKHGHIGLPGNGVCNSTDPPEGEAPQVIMGEDRGSKYFYMVQVLK